MIVRQYAPCSLGRSIICLGKQGEINALRVEFDVSAWMAMYPDATVKLMHFAPDRPQDNPVIPTLGVEGTLRVWIVGEEDTAGAGNGVIELLLIDERTGSTIKSATGYTTVLRSPSAGIEAQEAEAGYVRYDVDQSALLTDEQKAMARKNIGAGTGDETGSGGILKETDPTVPDWAKQPSKPTYTASEVGARPDTWTPSASEVGARPDTWTPSASEVGARPDTWTPSASDVGADAAGTASGAVATHNTSGEAHADLRALIEGLTSRLNALADSDDTTLDQLSEIVAYIKSNKALIDAVTTGKVSTSDIVDNLTTNSAGKVLSAAQGVALKGLIDAIVIPDKLPNPQPLTINGQSYDGSAAVEVSVSAGGGSTVELDTTLTQSGKAADAKAVGDQLSALNGANVKQDERLAKLEQTTPSGSSGLTVAQVNALGNMFAACAYDSESEYAEAYAAFREAFGYSYMYTVTNTLKNASNSNEATQVAEKSAYTATITPNDGYRMTSATVSMGGVDITDTAYADGVITIDSVTGDIVITATTVAAEIQDTSAVIEISDSGLNRLGDVKSVSGAGITKAYSIEDGDITHDGTNATGGSIKGAIVYGAGDTFVGGNARLILYDANGVARYYTNNATSNAYIGDFYNTDGREGTSGVYTKINDGTVPTTVKFTVFTAYANKSYAYFANTGRVIFAGVDSPYYGMANIDGTLAGP